MPIRIVVADDHPLILRGMEQLLRTEADIELVAQCTTGDDALRAAREHRPDVLILDLSMPGKDGFEVLRRLRADGHSTRVVLLTGALTEDEVLEAGRLDVKGIVLKEMATQFLVQCIRKVHGGGRWLERRSVGEAFERLLRREAGSRELATVLTTRELEVLRLAISGLRNSEIGSQLAVSEGTIKTHLHSIYDKLRVRNRVELSLYARKKGLV